MITKLEQGSILGPIFYLIYTSDLLISENLIILTFADNTAILYLHAYPLLASRKLNSYFRPLETWLKNWRN